MTIAQIIILLATGVGVGFTGGLIGYMINGLGVPNLPAYSIGSYQCWCGTGWRHNCPQVASQATRVYIHCRNVLYGTEDARFL